MIRSGDQNGRAANRAATRPAHACRPSCRSHRQRGRSRRSSELHRVRTLPFSVSKVLPPFLVGVASGSAAEEPSTSERLGRPVRAPAACCATAQTFCCIVSVFLWPVLQLLGDLRRNSAFCRVLLDICDHLQFGLAEIADQLAGFIRRRMPVARRLDQLAALLRLLAQAEGSPSCRHPPDRRPAAGRAGHAPFAARERCGAAIGNGAGRADGSGRRSAVDRRKWRGSLPAPRLVGQRRGKRALGKGLTGVQGHDGSGQRHNQAADDQGCFSGKVQAPKSSDRRQISDEAFYDS